MSLSGVRAITGTNMLELDKTGLIAVFETGSQSHM